MMGSRKSDGGQESVTEQTSKRYAPRSESNRQQLSVLLPARQVRFIRRDAIRRGVSVSLVVAELLEEAIFGSGQPAAAAE